MYRIRRIAALLILLLLLAAGAPVQADGLVEVGALAGRVTSGSAPLAAAAVYAYQLADLKLWKGVTDEQGRFRFETLPAGLYRIIAAKAGFLPAIVHLTRTSASTRQYVDVQLLERPLDMPVEASFWSVREQVPPDVLRDLGVIETTVAGTGEPGTEMHLETRLQALTGVDEVLEAGAAQLTGGRLDVRGEIRDIRLGIEGDFSQLQPVELHSGFSGSTQAVTFNVEGMGDARVKLSSTSNRLRMAGDAPVVGLDSHRVSWSQPFGEGRSQFAAQYTEQSNFYNSGLWAPIAVPLASRSWWLEGSYQTPLTDRASLETGFRYREREDQYSVDPGGLVEPYEQMELFGRGGLRIAPGLLVEYGLYSTLRDGSVWLAPRGGVVLQLSSSWQAGSSISGRFRTDGEDYLQPGFTPVYFGDSRPCEQGEELCYQVYLARNGEDGDRLSVGAIHRQFTDTLRLYFDRDFYNFFESLYLVEGDSLPEVQFELTRRLAPGILTRLESNMAAGGGGILLAANRVPYQNDVRYLVTSLDTRFERTATGVFLSFHHLAQQLSPVESHHSTDGTDMALERLQLMLTQDLNILDRLASDWALQLNMEVSRGSLPASRQYEDPDELRRRLTGGLTVRF